MKHLVMTTLFLPIAAFATAPSGVTECALLLPQGENYTYTIEGTVDRKQATSFKQTTKITIQGTQTLDFTPNGKQSLEAQAKAEGEAKFDKDTKPFKQCLERVLGQ